MSKLSDLHQTKLDLYEDLILFWNSIPKEGEKEKALQAYRKVARKYLKANNAYYEALQEENDMTSK